MKKDNVIIYLRVSTDEQANQGYSLEQQESVINKHCNAKCYNILQVYKEDFSAKTFERPEWLKLLAYIQANKGEVSKIIVHKWDRFSRNLYESLGMLNKLKKLNVSIESIEQPVDSEDPDSKLLQVIHLLFPEIENTKNSIRTKAGMRQASLNGCWVGKPPLGYERAWVQVDNGRNNASLKPNCEAEIVKEIFDYFLYSGLSAEKIRGSINKKYGKKISKQGVLNILTNICYLGKVTVKAYKGDPQVVVNGYHDAIISEEQFYGAQDILRGKRRKHNRKDNREVFPLKEIMKCRVCGSTFTASITTKNKGLNKYAYYHCPKTKGHDRFAKQIVESCFEDILSEFKVKEEILALYQRVVIETINSHNKGILAEKNKIESELERVGKRIRNAEDMLADDAGDRDAYLGMLRRFREEENTLIMKHATLKAQAMPKSSDVEYLLELFNSFDVLFKESDYPIKKKIVGSIFPKPMFFFNDHFRTQQVSPLLELLILNSNNLQRLKIETSHLKSGSSSEAPPVGLEPTTL
jgi:site-specific DNA recombinase